MKINPDTSNLPELNQLATQVGVFIQYWGFKKIHGQIWTHLFLSSEPLDAGDLIERLKVSKALISMSLSDLLEYQVILEMGKGSRNTNLYRANPDVTGVIQNVLRRRERQMLSQVDAALRLLGEIPAAEKQKYCLSHDQITVLSDFVNYAQSALSALLNLGPISFDFLRRFSKELK